MQVKRGEIYWVEFSPVKESKQGGLRPALIIQNDVGNAFSPTTIVIALTHTLPKRLYPFVVVVEPEESGLPDRSAVNCSQIATIQKDGAASRLRPPKGQTEIHPIGKLSLKKMALGRRSR